MTILDTIIAPAFSCFSRLAKYFVWKYGWKLHQNKILPELSNASSFLARLKIPPQRPCAISALHLHWYTEDHSQSFFLFWQRAMLWWLQFRVKFEIWFSLLAAWDQLSLAYLKGNINFPIYSLKLVVAAPCWSGKAPSVLIILMVGAGKGCEMPPGGLWAITAPFGELPFKFMTVGETLLAQVED